ncbi:nuclear transport factor 2 family protein [Homoserinimonas sp. A447]
MDASAPKPDRTLLGVLAVIAVLVVVAVVVVFTRGTPELHDPGTPERAVQEYAAAVIDGDFEAARELLAPAPAEDCVDFGPKATDLRLTLVETRERGETATVTVLVASGYSGGPFGGSGYEYEEAFQLEHSGDDWLISSAPWEFTVCPKADAS